MKKWNWGGFLVCICMCEIGAMGNKSIPSFGQAFLFGLVAGIIFGLCFAYVTREN